MFRGGRVDSRGTGITANLGYKSGGRVGYNVAGLVSPGMATELARGPRYSGQGLSGANIFQRALVKSKNLPFIGKAVRPLFGGLGGGAKLMTGGLGLFGAGALGGIGIGKGLDAITRATDSPEAYQFRKDAVRANPFLFDETSTDEFVEFSEELAEKQKEGEAPGLYPGGYEKFLKDKGYVKDEDGRVVKKEEIVETVKTDTPEVEIKDKNAKDSKTEESLDVGADLKKTQKLFEELLCMDKA